jgi:hypothetical protein
MENHKTERDSSPRKSNNADDGLSDLNRQSNDGTRGLVLDKWQVDVLNAKGHFLLCTGRQVGKTTIFAIKAAEHMINNPKSRIIVVSLTEDQAQLIIIMILNYLEKNYKDRIAKPYSKNITKNKIVLKNGSQVLSRPVGQTGDAVRGFTGDILIIDEASRMPESVFTASKPTLLTTGGKIWMCSTPFGRTGYFYESWLNKHDRFKVFHISSEEVIKNRPISASWTIKQHEEGIRMLDEEKLDMGELAYSQEYLGLFVDDLRRFFPDKIIDKCCVLKRNPQYYREGRLFLGLDIARLGDDSSTFEIFNKLDNENIHQVENLVTKKQLTTQTYDKILQLDETYDFKEIGIDAGSGSLGVGVLDFLLRSNVAKKMVALNNRTIRLDKWGDHSRGLLKEDMYDNLRSLMEKGTIKLLDDEELIASFKNIQIEFVMKEGMKTKIKIFGRNAHIVEGIIRAVWLANTKNINTFIDYV